MIILSHFLLFQEIYFISITSVHFTENGYAPPPWEQNKTYQSLTLYPSFRFFPATKHLFYTYTDFYILLILLLKQHQMHQWLRTLFIVSLQY